MSHCHKTNIVHILSSHQNNILCFRCCFNEADSVLWAEYWICYTRERHLWGIAAGWSLPASWWCQVRSQKMTMLTLAAVLCSSLKTAGHAAPSSLQQCDVLSDLGRLTAPGPLTTWEPVSYWQPTQNLARNVRATGWGCWYWRDGSLHETRYPIKYL